MGFTKITSEDTANKGVVGLADTPNLSTQEMQAKFDELATDVIIPKFNELSTELDDKNIDERFDERVVSEDISNIRLNRDNQLETSKDGGTTWETTASSGHIIENGAGTQYPSRARLQFSDNVVVMDDLVENKTFISIPAGEKGDKGESATIRVGNVEAGDSVKFENVGSDTDAIFDVTIPKGDKGDAATVRIGSVQTGDNPSVYNSGTTSNAIFNFVLPKGEKGDDGTSFQVLGLYATYADLIAAHPVGRRGEAYAVGDDTFNEVYNWNTSTLQWDNLGALKGAKGDTGLAATVTVGTVTQGNTTSVENVGTSENAVLNFVLEKGEKGDTGNAATIAIGSVEVGDYPEVTNVGTDTNAVLDFKLQRGPQGPQGTPTTVNGKTAASIELDTRDLLMTGYVKETEGDIATTDTLAVALSKLETRKSGGSIIKVTVDEELVGENITCANGEETYTKVATALTEFNVEGTGDWTITCGESEATVEISYFGIYETEIKARGAYNYIGWLESAPIIKTFASLEEVLADEVTLRTLFTKHASVDYLCEWIVADSTITEQILGTDLVAKWVNLRDYALDKLYEVAKASMDSLGKYGYGEWTNGVTPSVPIMTSNTTPSGEAFATNYDSGNQPYMAFDGNSSTKCDPNDKTIPWGIGYKFPIPISIGAFRVENRNDSYGHSLAYNYECRNSDSEEWTVVGSYAFTSKGEIQTHSVQNNKKYSQHRINVTTCSNYAGIRSLQFYTWGAKGLVPIMTSNSAPYGEVSGASASTSYPIVNVFDGKASTKTNFNKTDGSQNIVYKFVNPVCVKGVSITNSDVSAQVSKFEIFGANDTTNYKSLGIIDSTDTSIGAKTSYEVNSNEYFMYLKFVPKAVTGSDGYGNLAELQFYGRQLTVSVPKMDSNTSPWGEASSSTEYSDEFKAFKAFTNSPSTEWATLNQTTNAYIQYSFDEPTCVKMVQVSTSYYTNVVRMKNYKVLASNDNFVSESHELATKVYPNDSSLPLQFTAVNDGNELYKDYRIFILDTYGDKPIYAKQVNFYALDYSEHTERKWIYDHGVEVETLEKCEEGGNSFAIRESNQLLLKSTNTSNAHDRTSFDTANTIDITPFNLVRMRIGDTDVADKWGSFGLETAKAFSGNAIGNKKWIASEYPNNLYLDCSSINQSLYCYINNDNTSGSGTAIRTITEWWLE